MTAWGPEEERASTPPTPIPGSVSHAGAAQAPDTTFSTFAEKRRPRGDQAFLEAEEPGRRRFLVPGKQPPDRGRTRRLSGPGDPGVAARNLFARRCFPRVNLNEAVGKLLFSR